MEKQSITSSLHRIGFYPCCCRDIEEPRRFLAPFVDEILFCDMKRSTAWNQVRDEPGLPKATLLEWGRIAGLARAENGAKVRESFGVSVKTYYRLFGWNCGNV